MDPSGELHSGLRNAVEKILSEKSLFFSTEFRDIRLKKEIRLHDA